MQIVWLAPLSSLPFLSEMSSLTEGKCVARNRSDVLNLHTITPMPDTMYRFMHVQLKLQKNVTHVMHKIHDDAFWFWSLNSKNWVGILCTDVHGSICLQFESSAEFYGQNCKALGYNFVLISNDNNITSDQMSVKSLIKRYLLEVASVNLRSTL